jgi:hypothetical protein
MEQQKRDEQQRNPQQDQAGKKRDPQEGGSSRADKEPLKRPSERQGDDRQNRRR